MAKKFEISMMGELKFFLGLQVKQLADDIFVFQAKYIAYMLKKYGFSDCKTAKTLMCPSASFGANPNGTNVNEPLYRGKIGSLLYLTANYLDIMFATILYACYQASPKESHLLVVKRIFRYLNYTPNLGLWYPRHSKFKLVGYTDSDHGGCGIDRKSTSGGVEMIGDRLVSWSSKMQTLVACSTTEAEYVAIGRRCAQILWIQNKLLYYVLNFSKTPIYCYNTSSIHMI
ncbi:secreted RxLR effector protein 161-like [Lactuca sativa]|uniref:secreted RxLR effector protein 161-like n=1 Tax=Lactuca sativa TaxID=4236 RepID=UPI0022AE6CD6|nr:secreted RxLR effector protein 161-like [Lactuca sativa]